MSDRLPMLVSSNSNRRATFPGKDTQIAERIDMANQRRFRQGDGTLTIGPGEVVLLDYLCAACGRAYEMALQGSDRPALIDCNEERLCEGCQKKSLVMMLLERGTNVPEENLLTMTLDDLLDLAKKP